MGVKEVVSLVLFWGLFAGTPLFMVTTLVVGAIQWHRMSHGDRTVLRDLLEHMPCDSEWSSYLGNGGESW